MSQLILLPENYRFISSYSNISNSGCNSHTEKRVMQDVESIYVNPLSSLYQTSDIKQVSYHLSPWISSVTKWGQKEWYIPHRAAGGLNKITWVLFMQGTFQIVLTGEVDANKFWAPTWMCSHALTIRLSLSVLPGIDCVPDTQTIRKLSPMRIK